jgi:hypothetical protein
MNGPFASEFAGIPDALAENASIREKALQLVLSDPIPGKATEGGERLDVFRTILADLINGEMMLADAISQVEQQLPLDGSIHAGNNRVFSSKWAERLVRTQFSRFYNQAVIEVLRSAGHTECFVPHSGAEAEDSPCSIALAGGTHSLELLHDRLTASYRDGQWSQDVKIPNHPHCTHVVRPSE